MWDVDLGELFVFSLPIGEIVLRGSVVYWFLFVLFRAVARRDIGAVGLADNGRIFKFVVSKHNPRRVTSFSVFADGDVPETDPTYVEMTSPDNVDTSRRSLMVQEDTANANILRHDFRSGEWSTVATVVNADGESSGIVDASRWFGKGAWLSTVQIHDPAQWVDSEVVSTDDQGNPTLTLKREDGQLLLVRVPGS